MSSPVPLPTDGRLTESRIGTVVVATPNSVFVDVGGAVFEAAFVVPFLSGTVTPPPAGTVVQIVRQDASWIVQGRVVGAGSNSVLNPSFEQSAAGTFPVSWFGYDSSGVSTATVADVTGAPEGSQAARVYSGAAAVHFLYSSPIPVTSGDVWSVSAFVGGDYAGGSAQTADAGILAFWFANATNLYPTTSSADTLMVIDNDVPQYPPFSPMFQSVVAPVTGFMRIALRSTLAAGQALVWDNVIARRV